MKKEESFEHSLESLESIVSKLEEGDQPLEESLELFEEGVRLARLCQQRLEKAERRIEMLIKDSEGSPSLIPFSEEEAEADGAS